MRPPTLTVCDFSQGIAGPYAGRLFAEFGARVIKIEPRSGDWSRGMGVRTHAGQSSMYEFYNMGKQGISLDLTDRQCRDVARAIIGKSDVLIHNFKVGSEGKFGLDDKTVLQINPDIVLLSINGFGVHGSLASSPATDTTIQAFSGFADAAAPSQDPCRIRVAVADIFTGARAYQIALESLLRKQMGMPYERVNAVSMLEAMSHLMGYKVFDEFILGSKTIREALPATGIYPCDDGHISISCSSQLQVEKLALLLDPDGHSRGSLDLADQDSVQPFVASAIAPMSVDAACSLLATAGVPCVRVHSIRDFVRHPQVASTGVFEWRNIDGIELPNVAPRQGTNLTPAPRCDEHRQEILEWVHDDI